MLGSSRLSISSPVRSWCIRMSHARFAIGYEGSDIPGVKGWISRGAARTAENRNLAHNPASR